MKQITNSEYEKYQQYVFDRMHGRVLTPDGIRFICEANDLEPEKIGKNILEVYGRLKNSGMYNSLWK